MELMSDGLPIVNLFLHRQHLVDSQAQVSVHVLVTQFKIVADNL